MKLRGLNKMPTKKTKINKMKLRWIWLKQDMRRLYYRIFHGIKIDGFSGSILPEFGKGKFVDVLKKGSYIDIVSHTDYPNCKKGTIRIIPVQYNHGVMVEFINENGNMEWRGLCDYRRFYLEGAGICEKSSSGKNTSLGSLNFSPDTEKWLDSLPQCDVVQANIDLKYKEQNEEKNK